MIETIGRISTTNKHPNRIMPSWVLGIVHSGTRTVKVCKHEACLSAGDYFLLPPNTYHSGISEDSHDVSFIHFNMPGQPIDTPMQLNSGQISLPIFGQIPPEIDFNKSFGYLYEQYRSELVNNHFLNIQLQALLYQISFCMQKRQVLNDRNNKLADDVFKYILVNLNKQLSSDTFQHQFQLSYRQLNTIFKKQFQTTIKQKIIELRVDQALNMIIQGESIATAAENCGFKDYFYFLKCFKKHKKHTPKEIKQVYSIH